MPQSKLSRRRGVFSSICFTWLLIVSASSVAAVDRFVGPQGSDTNNSLTKATAWKTLTHAFGNWIQAIL